MADDDAARLINSNTWGKRIRGDKWTVEETLRFYDVRFSSVFPYLHETDDTAAGPAHVRH